MNNHLRELFNMSISINNESTYDKVNNKIIGGNITDKAIYDSFNKRWIKCEKCNTIKQADEFSYYGGPQKETIGLCNDCYRKEREK